jgi:hypothetical protein
MYDYRMSIENMQAKVTVTHPVDTMKPIQETETQRFFFAYDRGRIRYEKNQFNSKSGLSWLDQSLSTPEFYFLRHPHGTPEVNDGNCLFLDSPLAKPLETFDPRRIGTDRYGFGTIEINHFNYDTLLDMLYNARCENYNVSMDMFDDEKCYKVSFQVRAEGSFGSGAFWIDPQKGYNLVRGESEAETLDWHDSYSVTLSKFTTHRGEIWFPQLIMYKYRMKVGGKKRLSSILSPLMYKTRQHSPSLD